MVFYKALIFLSPQYLVFSNENKIHPISDNSNKCLLGREPSMNKINCFCSFKSMTEAALNNMAVATKKRIDHSEGEFSTWNDNVAYLAAQDTQGKSLSIFNEECHIGIVCDSVIYNSEAISLDLKARGLSTKPQNDAELILSLYREHGADCVNYLEGAFAFVIYDQKNEKIFAARDKLGQKLLYYTWTNGGLAISSSVNTLVDQLDNQLVINKKVVRDTLAYSYSQSRFETWACGIQKVEPAQYLEFSQNSFNLKRYWKKHYKASINPSVDDAAKQVLKLLEESVVAHIPSDQAFAIPLSGGIDSSSIACLAKRHKEEIHTITIGYKGEHDCDERALAKRLAKEKGFIWHEVELAEENYLEYFEEYMPLMEEPVGDPASIAQWATYKKAKELGIPILLSGNGGDEIFYGYSPHNSIAASIYEQNKLAELCKRRTTLYKYLLGNSKKFFESMKKGQTKYSFMPYAQDIEILPKDWKSEFDFKVLEEFENYFNDEFIPEAKVYSYLFNVWLMNNCLHLGSVLSSPHDVEIRSPYLNGNLIEYVSSLPSCLVFSSVETKYLLKKALKEVLPLYILEAPKRGFTPANDKIQAVISHYTPKFFDKKTTTYNQVVMDAFLARYK